MTTIAWDGLSLAADRMSSSGYAQRTVTKLWKGKWLDGRDVLIGFAGDGAFCQAIMDALQFGKTKEQMPDWRDYNVEKNHTMAVVVDRDKNVYEMTVRFELLPYDEVVFAIGAGAEVAWGALEAGANAVRAIQIAGKRTPHTGLGVQQIRFSDPPESPLDN